MRTAATEKTASALSPHGSASHARKQTRVDSCRASAIGGDGTATRGRRSAQQSPTQSGGGGCRSKKLRRLGAGVSRQPGAKYFKSVMGEKAVSSLETGEDEAGEEWVEEKDGAMLERRAVSMVKGKVQSYPMSGKIWKGVEADAEDEDEEQLLPAVVYLWVQRDGPTAVDIVKDHKFNSEEARAESLRLAISYDGQAHTHNGACVIV